MGHEATELGRYEVIRRLDVSGFAQVDLVRDGPGGALCVLTSLAEGCEADAGAFVHEARLIERIEDPHLVGAIARGDQRGQPFLVQALPDGATLHKLIEVLTKNGIALPYRSVAELGRAVARGLAAIHGAKTADGTPLGLVHGDVTPATILCSRRGEVKISDYAFARQALVVNRDVAAKLASLPGYRAPEARRGQMNLGAAADLFGLGLILAELASRRRIADDEVDSAIETLPKRIESMVAINLDVPEDLADLIGELCALDPRERPRSAEETASRLSSIAKALPAKHALAPTLHDYFARFLPSEPVGGRGQSIPDVDTVPDDSGAIPEAATAIEHLLSPNAEPQTEPNLSAVDDEDDLREDALSLDTPPPRIAHGAMAQLELGADTSVWPSPNDAEDGPERLDSDFLVPVAAAMPDDVLGPPPAETPPARLILPLPNPGAPKGRLIQLKSDPRYAPPPGLLAPAPPEPAASNKPDRRRLVIGLVAGAALSLGAVLVYVALDEGRSPQTEARTEAPPARPTSGRLAVRSKPQGADIFLDGAPTGRQTPSVLTGVPLGTKIAVSVQRRGFVGVPDPALVFVPESVGTAAVDFVLEPARKYTLESVPSGATVRFGERMLDGETPLELPAIPIDESVVVEVTLDGFEPTVRTIRSTADDPAVMSISLDRQGSLHVISDPPAADVRLDGRLMGRAPIRLTVPNKGRFEIVVERPGYRRVKKQLQAGRTGDELEIRLNEQPLLSMPLTSRERQQAKKLVKTLKRHKSNLRSARRGLRRAEKRLHSVGDGEHQFVHALAEAQRAVDIQRQRVRRLETGRDETTAELEALTAQVLTRLDR